MFRPPVRVRIGWIAVGLILINLGVVLLAMLPWMPPVVGWVIVGMGAASSIMAIL